MRPPTLSVVVPATNLPSTLPRCLAALAAADGVDEVVVVDSPRALSASEARNAGAKRATGEVVVFVDGDVTVRPDALARIRTHFANDPGLAAVFGSYDDAPDDRGVVSSFRNLLHHHVHQRSAGPAQTFWSGLGAVRREAFLGVGGFDARRYPYPSVEDVDLGVRLVGAGARIVLDPAIQGTHLKVWSLRTMVFTDFARRGVPWVALLLRTGSIGTPLNLGWRHRISAACCLSGAVAVLARRPGPALGAATALVVLNRDFYAVLLRVQGPRAAVLGVGLHAVHHLVGVAAVPVGVVSFARDRRRTPEAGLS